MKKIINRSILLNFFFYIILFILLTNVHANASNGLCARVKIQIHQEMTFERQAFNAHMRINNGFDAIVLQNVNVDILFSDEDGKHVVGTSDPNNTDATFFYRIDTMDNIDDVGGNGTVHAATSADIHWLIIPAYNASNGLESGTLYYVGATLTYTINGEKHVINVIPDYIFVNPMPLLKVDYFLPRDLEADDAFTNQIEPEVPFYLGVRVSNIGHGTANKLKIESAQPKIIENDLDLLIGFSLVGSEVNGEKATDSLLVNFGDIAPNTSGTARWIMKCSLSGEFIDFYAEYTHADELGGELTSLIEDVHTHFLLRDVLVDLPGRDHIRDFLAKDGAVIRVFESDNLETEVINQSSRSTLEKKGNNYTLTTPETSGFMFVQLPDPFNGTNAIYTATRSDGKVINPNNVWLSKCKDLSNNWRYFFNLFDVNTTTEYYIQFKNNAHEANAPVMQFIPDRFRVEGQQLSFIVETSDPDGNQLELYAYPLPVGSSFVDKGNGEGIFDWKTKIGQAGKYPVTFSVTDGKFITQRQATLIICSISDTDCDGMNDEWELKHFGSLDRDGTGDYDHDGFTDLEEYVNKTDPTKPDNIVLNPVADAGPDQKVLTNKTVHLNGLNTTQGDAIIKDYLWQQVAGPQIIISTPNNITTTFISPKQTEAGGVPITFQLKITDKNELVSYDSCIINVSNDNIPPQANAGSDQTIKETTDYTITLDGTNSTDEDGTIETWFWYQLTGPSVNLSDVTSAKSEFVLPDNIGQDGDVMIFQLTVIDDQGLKSQDICIVNIAPNNTSPQAIAGEDQEIISGSKLILDASSSYDTDDSISAYRWFQTYGPPVVMSDPTNEKPVISIPKVLSKKILKFRLIVTDTAGFQSKDVCKVVIHPSNRPPVAEAGESITAYEKNNVRLDGSNSYDPDGDPISFFWKQLSVPDVILSDPNDVQPVFVAPEVDSSEKLTLVFELSVEDNDGLVSKDTCICYILDKDENEQKTIFVGPKEMFTTIQSAIDASKDGYMIIVKDGTYIENVIVHKELSIISENGAVSTIVTAENKNKHVFSIEKNNVKIEGFTIYGATEKGKSGIYINKKLTGCKIIKNLCGLDSNRKNYNGIYAALLNKSTISDNKCCANFNGIILENSRENRIINNENYLNTSNGIHLIYSIKNECIKNILYKNQNGFNLFYSYSNQLIKNQLNENFINGVRLEKSFYNVLIANQFFDNTIYNLSINKLSYYNKIFLNSFSNNAEHNIFSDCVNTWNSLSKLNYTFSGYHYKGYLGNYYSQQKHEDTNNDGIVDTSFDLPGLEYFDYYPLSSTPDNYILTEDFYEAKPLLSLINGINESSIKKLDHQLTSFQNDFSNARSLIDVYLNNLANHHQNEKKSQSIHIAFDKIPPYGNRIQNLKGHITTIDNQIQYQIVVYSFLNYWQLKKIRTEKKQTNHSHWVCDITTLPGDEFATQIAAFLLPKTNRIPEIVNSKKIPTYLYKNSFSFIQTERNPYISVTQIPEYNNRIIDIQGIITNISYSDHYIAVYTYNTVWKVKPYQDKLQTSISSSGLWNCDITTDAFDQHASIIQVFLFPKNYYPPTQSSYKQLPEELFENTIKSIRIIRDFRLQ